MSRIKSIYRFPNGMVAVIGHDHQQIPEFQGHWEDAQKKISKEIGRDIDLSQTIKIVLDDVGAEELSERKPLDWTSKESFEYAKKIYEEHQKKTKHKDE